MGKYYIQIGEAASVQGIRYGFYAGDDDYNNIAAGLGVVDVTDGNGAEGITYGVNSPKPPRVRIAYSVPAAGGGQVSRSVTRFCAPEQLAAVLGGSINGEQILVAGEARNITGVSTLG